MRHHRLIIIIIISVLFFYPTGLESTNEIEDFFLFSTEFAIAAIISGIKIAREICANVYSSENWDWKRGNKKTPNFYDLQ